MTEEQRDVIDVLEHDHREVEQMFSELESLSGASSEEAKARRKAVTEQVTIELVRHSVAEEVLVYPQVEEKVSGEEAEHALRVKASFEGADRFRVGVRFLRPLAGGAIRQEHQGANEFITLLLCFAKKCAAIASKIGRWRRCHYNQ